MIIIRYRFNLSESTVDKKTTTKIFIFYVLLYVVSILAIFWVFKKEFKKKFNFRISWGQKFKNLIS